MKPLAGSLDTNVLLRLLLDDVPDQHVAVVKLLQRASGQFAVADTALIEIVFVLERNYQFTRVQIAEAVEGLTTLKQIVSNRSLFEKALPVFLTHTTLSFEDCCLAAYAELNSAEPLWTFDKKLAGQVSSAKLIPTK